MTVAACGAHEEKAADAPHIRLSPLRQPDRADCAVPRLTTRHRAADRVPRPGAYRYRLAGTQGLSGEPSSTLRGEMTVTVTSAREIGRLRCYRVRHALAADISETATFVVRGDRLYITQLQSLVGGHDTRYEPDPPVLAFDPDRTSWAGAFSGATSGSYRGRLVGRRFFQIAGDRVRAVGVRLTLATSGESTGIRSSLQWGDSRSNLVVHETVRDHRNFGVDQLRLSYRARARALAPRP